jgi:CheY-like chemotaxis protein
MLEGRKNVPMLMAEDDRDDCLLAQKAMLENRIANPLMITADGEELLDYLFRRGKYSDSTLSPQPRIIPLDLNMPKMDGREALRTIKTDEKLKKITVVIMTVSEAEEVILVSCHMGANSYLTKPVTFVGWMKVIKALKDYWQEIVEIPTPDGALSL